MRLTRAMVNEKEEKLARTKEWRRKKQEKNSLRNLKYNEKNRKKRGEKIFPTVLTRRICLTIKSSIGW